MSQDPTPPATGSRRVFVGVLIGAILVAALAALVSWLVARGTSDATSPSAGACSAERVARDVMPSVVTVLVRGANGAASNGSGQFLDEDGNVLTNDHVISSAASGGTIAVLRPNGEQTTATIVGRDPRTDLAVIRTAPESPVKPIRFDTGDLTIGQPVFAIGAPLGLSDSLTSGVVSGLGRSVRVPSDGETALLLSAIQTDASINPGNSGGTLADCDGDLVGVPTAGATANDSQGGQVAGSIGIGFAVPAATAQAVAEELLETGRVEHGDLGLAAVPVAGADGEILGLYVTEVTQGGPTATAGVRRSDVITSIDGADARSLDQLQAVGLTRRAGETVDLTYTRDGESSEVTVTLGPAT